MKHTFAIYVDHTPGALNRVASVFRRRRFNILSLTAGQTEEQGVFRLTVVIDTDAYGAKRVEATLSKVIDVIRVCDITDEPLVHRELAMIRVATPTPEGRSEVTQLVEVFGARIIDASSDAMIVEATGTVERISGLLDVLKTHGILELVRTGPVGMARGMRTDARNAG